MLQLQSKHLTILEVADRAAASGVLDRKRPVLMSHVYAKFAAAAAAVAGGGGGGAAAAAGQLVQQFMTLQDCQRQICHSYCCGHHGRGEQSLFSRPEIQQDVKQHQHRLHQVNHGQVSRP